MLRGLIILFLLINSSLLHASKPAVPKIIAIEIPGLFQKNGQGEYDMIITKVSDKMGEKLPIQYLPPGRVFTTFKKCTDCCLSPANKNPEFYDYGANYIQTQPMAIAKVYIFSKHHEFTNLKELKNLKVGARRGMPYGRSYEKAGLNVELTNKIEQNIKKLEAGRLDAFIAYSPDVFAAFKALNIKPFKYAKNAPIAVHEDNILCHKNATTTEFIQRFNKALAKINASQ